ncbi:hypothetical protein [Nocardia fluminea]|uniref:Uncharacterized protein n=1 Tax=Nocardia fluminea TaxID=134984 RepID=A0A2N3V657_9NOCA|nr:hypothetical protein [Nocardia fluminea]PKV77112.1 hypothetical protein ATK86_1434 [Nocardia fluminea]
MIAGAPAIVGAVIGAGANNPELSALLLGIGVGAIVQVIVQIAPSLREPGTTSVSARTLAGIGVGMLTMYATGLLVAG